MRALPGGTVSFLFTDIEGCTRLWEEQPESMRLALIRYDALLRDSMAQHNGYVFKTNGDAFCVAFPTALDALHAAITAQRALLAEMWPEVITIKVRMALHTGAAESRDNDYFGPPLNRVSRLLAAGHGGQVLVSAITQELTHDELPPPATLQSLGEHRLRDLNHSENIFQLLHPALPSDFPPLNSLDNSALPNNLPQQVTSFIGREKEIAEVKTLLTKTRLLTLTGSGGSGKTRLALQVAADVMEHYPNGVWLVELAPLADPTLVPQTVAAVLNLREQAGKPFLDMLADTLKSRHLLLVLDNCEHLLNACAALADALLRACPHVKILASSREALGITGELAYRVPSLTLPDPKQPVTFASILQYEAVCLFLERARFHKTDFTVSDQNAPALASVCHRLDGIPLAIELAAARVKSLSVAEISTRLDNRFRLLTGGSKTALPRQQTLRALIDWSYDLLSVQEKALLCRLSVFAGGWTLEAAEQVCVGESETDAGIEDWEVLDLLTGLVDKSLAIAEIQGEGTRYRLLETVRQYAGDRLLEDGKGEEVRRRHRDYFLALAEEVMPKLTGAEQAYWLERVEAEHDNMRLALAFCLEETEGAEAGLRLGTALALFWDIRGHISEGRERLKAILSRATGPEQRKMRADILTSAGNLALNQGDYAAARTLYEESLTLSRELEDKRGIAACYINLGHIAFDQGDYAMARALYEEGLTLSRELGGKRGIARSLCALGNVTYSQGDYASARSLYEESLTLFRELGDKGSIAACLSNLGNIAYHYGDHAAIRALQEESLTIYRELGNKWSIAKCLISLGLVASAQGDYTSACAQHEESLALFRELGDKRGIAICLINLGNAAYDQGDYGSARSLYTESLTIRQAIGDKEGIANCLDAHAFLAHILQKDQRAARLWGASSSLREAIGCPRPPFDQEKFDHQTAQTRTLGEAAFDTAFEEGRAMNWEQAIAFALEVTP